MLCVADDIDIYITVRVGYIKIISVCDDDDLIWILCDINQFVNTVHDGLHDEIMHGAPLCKLSCGFGHFFAQNHPYFRPARPTKLLGVPKLP